ncbi:hypothetical protein IMC39_003219 [Salmonella enterica]|nr:hypothetical protein [Salmonella enterica]EGL7477246.1 hypothetical protein [Salmonella enterica]EGL7478653.1 hypothetical protein [Salmonella enterica]HCM1914624.1 hypothetical protein [Salmonella enterica subsp. salamae serovar 28:r:e,n,z15]
MQKAEREAAIAANKKPIPPEQMLIICTDLRALTKLIRENRGINSPAKAADVLDRWIDSTEERAWRDIAMRKW